MFSDTQLLMRMYWRIDRRADDVGRFGWLRRGILFTVIGFFSALMGVVLSQVVVGYLSGTVHLDVFPGIILLLVLFGTTVAGLNQGLQALFLSDDLEKLFVAPVSSHAIVTAKLLGRVPTVVFFVLAAAVPALVAFGVVAELGPVYYVLSVLLALVAPLFGISIGSIIAILLVRVLPARRLSEWIGAVSIFLGTAVLMLSYVPRLLGDSAKQQFEDNVELIFTEGLNRYSAFPLPTNLAARAMVHLSQGNAVLADLWGMLSYLLITVGLFGLTIVIADRLYLTSWLRMQSSGARTRGLGESDGVFGGSSLDVILGYKDWLLRVRDRRLLATLFSGLLVAGFMAFYLFRTQGDGASILAAAGEFGQIGILDVIFRQGVVVSGTVFLVAWMSFSRIAASALSMERGAVYILKSAPVSAARIMRAKVYGILVPYMVLVTVLMLIAAFAFKLSVPWLPYAWLVQLIIGFGSITYSVSLDFVYPNLTWDDPRKMTSGRAALPRFIGFAAYAIVAVLIALATFALAVYARPASVPIVVFGLGVLAGGTWFFVGWCTRRVEAAWPSIGA